MPIRFLDDYNDDIGVKPMTESDVLTAIDPSSRKSKIRFLDESIKDQPDELIKNQPQAPGFFQKAGQQYYSRARQVRNIPSTDTMAGQGLQALGAGMGLMGDIGSDISHEVGKAAYNVAHPIAPGLTDLIANTPEYIARSIEPAVAPAAKYMKEKYDEYIPEGTEFRRNVEATGNIVRGELNTVPLVQGGKALSKVATKIGTNVGDALIASGEVGANKARSNFINNLIRPTQTKKVSEQFVGKGKITETPVLRRAVYNQTDRELEIAKDVSAIQGVKPSQSYIANHNAIVEEISKEAESLKPALANLDYSKAKFYKTINKASKEVESGLTGDSKVYAQKVAKKIKSFANESDGTLAGLLEARKKLDKWVETFKGEGIFDPVRESSQSLAVRKIRTSVNDFLEKSAPDVGVMKSLRKQSNLYIAKENIVPKAAEELRKAPSAAKRLIKKVSDAIPGSNAITKTAASTAGLAGIGTAAAFAPALTGLTLGSLAAYHAGKAAAGPTARKAAGKAIKMATNPLQQLINR